MLEKIKSIIERELNLDVTSVTAETNFKDDLEADSLDLYQVILALEEEYGIEIEPEALEGCETVGSIIEYLKNEKGIED